MNDTKIVKDSVENRKRISLRAKMRIALIALKENGLIWFCQLAIYYIASTVENAAYESMDRRRRRKGIPGLNSLALNKAIWESWDWTAGGEEWTSSDAWKASVVRCVLQRYLPERVRVLEIGPGAGRWTTELIGRSSTYTGVDISASCIDLCKTKFSGHAQATFRVGSGSDLRDIPDRSIDALWSFDVFVHINETEVDAYANEFKRVMAPAATGVVHHGGVGGAAGGWRSNVTRTSMLDLLRKRGFEIVDSFSEWQDQGTVQNVSVYKDSFTVFRLPG
ncbi:MAG: class I SAM-dependent methyltransferase [Steroidobacteraceae bacterium]